MAPPRQQVLPAAAALALLLAAAAAPARGQQEYEGNKQNNCYATNASSALGYACNAGSAPACDSYLVYRASPPLYASPLSISYLLNISVSAMAAANAVPTVSPLAASSLVLAPVPCACTPGGFYQHNSSYPIQFPDPETQFSIANITYQGLTTCQALIALNPLQDSRGLLVQGSNLTVSLRCACPSPAQAARGVRHLLSYLVTWGDDVASIAARFRVHPQDVLDANSLAADDIIFPFTTLLIPLKAAPTVDMLASPAPPPAPAPAAINTSTSCAPASSCGSNHTVAVNTSTTPWPCAPASCGNLTITFPFWLAGTHPPECGYKAFQVTCDKANTNASLKIKNSFWEYTILNIFYDNSSFIATTNVDLSNSSCNFGLFSNASTDLGVGPFTISPQNLELFFVFGCDPRAGRAPRSWPWASVACADYRANNDSFALFAARNYTPGDTVLVMPLPGGCNVTMMPVLGYKGATGADYQRLIKRGFLLQYTADDCAHCTDSGGQCRVNVGDDDFECHCSDGNGAWSICGGKHTKSIVGIAFGVGASALLVACFFFIVWCKRKRKSTFSLFKRTNGTTLRNIEALIVSYGSLAPKKYKYTEAIKITSSFNTKLGEGSYGMVFKGRLDDGRLVAVKFLHDSKGNGEEFVNEVMSIGRTSHVNIVSLFGFCLEGSKRALIYEYMPNGSLDKYIYSENPKAVLGWDKLYMIAIGIARGLEYLHHSCNTRIVHFDIKPQNILLDQDFHPKIADFGLAKLCRTKESKLSMTGARGTVGFIAPEVHSRTFGVVSTKSDVYSYGMMLLEMVGGRKNVKSMAQKSSEKYFPHWIYDHFGQDEGLEACEVISGNEGIAKKMSVIGLWCIQILPMHRPTITKVLEMFERSLDELDMPPRQNFSQIFEDSVFSLNTKSTSMSSASKRQVSSEALSTKEISAVNSKVLQRLPTL